MNRSIRHDWKRIAKSGAVLALTIAAPLLMKACAVNPATGTPNFVLMSESREIELGAEEHLKIMDKVNVYHDARLAAYVTEVGERIAAVGDRPELDYQFFVMDDPAINAFALPGGYVYINRGLLAFLNSEAQLAAVLGHEIAHITARHAVQHDADGRLARFGAQVSGIVTAVVTQNSAAGASIANVASIWAAAGLSGFGREDELEADRLGAEYMSKAGYDPQATIDMLTVLKNHSDFRRLTSTGGGGYHGLFASHPRNDRRLQQAIAEVRQISPGTAFLENNDRFREIMDGLVLGTSVQSQTNETRNRYYQPLFGYTLVFPDQWDISETTTTAAATAPEGHSLSIEAVRLQGGQSPREFLAQRMKSANLLKSEALEQFNLDGHTAVVVDPASGARERVAVLFLNSRAFVFRGALPPGGNADELDGSLLESIKSFRAMEQSEFNMESEQKIRYAMVDENFSFEAAARNANLGEHAEETLRLLNGYYPRGEPEPGDWVKLVE